MKITFWGIRGSIPVPDPDMMRYGGNTTCVEADLDGETFIIDAGTGIKRLGETLAKRKTHRINLFITHSHWDHIQGFPFFIPAYNSKVKLNIYTCKKAYSGLRNILSNQMSQKYFPITFEELKSNIKFIQTPKCSLTLSGHKLSFIQTNHPTLTNAVKIEKNSKSFVFMTDNELKSSTPATSHKKLVEFCRGAKYLIHDAQFTEEEYTRRRGWGHSSIEQALALALEAGAENLGLVHHDPGRTDYQLEALEKKFKHTAKKSNLNLFMVKENTRVYI